MMSNSINLKKDIELEKKERSSSASTDLVGGEAALVVFEKLSAAEAALRVLKASGFDMNNLVVVAKEVYDREQKHRIYRLDGAIISWTRKGVFWGWVMGLLFGSALVVMPPNGPIVAGGPIVCWLTCAFESSLFVGAIGALGAALVSRRLNEEQLFKAEPALKGKSSSLVHAAETKIKKVKTTLYTGEQL
jgi:uncharacterized membrane protein